MSMLETVCFELDFVTPELVAKLMEAEWLRFEPLEVRGKVFGRSRRYRREHHIRCVREAGSLGSLALEGVGDSSFEVATVRAWNARFLYWKLAAHQGHSIKQIGELGRHVGFRAAYAGDREDVFWQSQHSINTFELHGRPHESLAKIRDPDTGQARIDISRNPGRRSLFPGMWLQAAWRMWFGGEAFRYLPKARLLDFAEAVEVRELENGVVFIQLFDDPFEASSAANRERQAAFREWVGMDELEARAREIAGNEADVRGEIEHGSFPHGGTRRAVCWLDSDDRRVPRSGAVRRQIVELDESGVEVWRGEVEV